MSSKYSFTSQRLGFRTWQEEDIDAMAAINADPQVMEFFPSLQDRDHTAGFVARMQKQFAEKGYCYFAVEKLSDGRFIGFIGIAEQTFESPFTPCTDIGWRLCKKEWGNGYATEGAKACLDYAFGTCGLTKISAIAPVINVPSVNVMRKLGMKMVSTFNHPLLANDERLRNCVLYEIPAG